MTHNHAYYQARLDFIQDLLRTKYKIREPAQITPIQYDPTCPFKYNNFIFHIKLPASTYLSTENASLNDQEQQKQQPGTVPIPPETPTFILRLTNPSAAGMHLPKRVENEVAMISLASLALGTHLSPSIVPRIYAWGSATEPSSQGWILQEYMQGEPGDEIFEKMALEGKIGILGQIARIVKGFQGFEVPGSIKGYGGVAFDESGRIVSAVMPGVGIGPWESYVEYFDDRFIHALKEADESPHIKGWRENEVRGRLDAFFDACLLGWSEQVDDGEEKCIVHADLTPNNLLIDAETGQITALLDYDFSCILHPSWEFFRSFGGAGGSLQVFPGGDSPEQAALRDAKLHGYPSPLPQGSPDGDVDWVLAKAWEDQLEKLDVKRPRTMKGIERAAELDALLSAITPWRLCSEDLLSMQSEETILSWRKDCEGQLIKLLNHLMKT